MSMLLKSMTDTLERVIATSPVIPLKAPYWVVRAAAPVPASESHLATVSDGVETTVVTSATNMMRLLPASEVEGPFACFRLVTSLSFGAPGFIAAATSACAGDGLNVFVISTFSFDYLLVPLADRSNALDALARVGFPIA